MQRFEFLRLTSNTREVQSAPLSPRLCVSAVAFALLLSPTHSLARPKATAEKKLTLLSLRLFPQNVTLWGAGSSQRFIALGKYSDGLERDVTRASRFSLQDSSVATLSNEGRVTARSDGSTAIVVELDGQHAESPSV